MSEVVSPVEFDPNDANEGYNEDCGTPGINC